MGAHLSTSNPDNVPDSWSRLLTWIALVCVVLSCAVFLRRAHAAFEAASTAPGVAVTSGFEEESFFAVWRAGHDRPVYADATRLPFASAYFNWLFYSAYALPVRAAMPLTGDAGIPLIGRLVTAVGAIAGGIALLLLAQRVRSGQPAVAAALAAFVFSGPLVGWWAHTLRPDIWALTLEMWALVALLLGYRRRPLGTAMVTALLFYGAWAFKQTYVLGLGAALLFLIYRRQWRPASVLTLASIGLWLATFLLMGTDYRTAFLHVATTNVYYPALGLRNLGDMLVKSAPLWLLLMPLLSRSGNSPCDTSIPLARDTRTLGWLGLLSTLPPSFAASCKLGATSNYYFTSLVMLSLLAIGLVALPGSRRWAMPGLLAAAALQCLVLMGYAGKTDLADQTGRLTAIWRVWQEQPEPRFSSLTSLNLPWLNVGSPSLVIAFNYGLERSAGRSLEHGGLGGLIADGYFRSLLLPSDTGEEYDGASLRRYRRGTTSHGLAVFHREPAPTK